MIIDCFMISFVIMLLIFGIDQLLRRKQQGKRSRQEKQSLLIGIVCVPAYVLMSLLGVMLSIAQPQVQTQYSGLLFESAMLTGKFIWVVSLAAIIAGFVLRRQKKPQAAKLAQLAAMGYIAVFGFLCVASGLL